MELDLTKFTNEQLEELKKITGAFRNEMDRIGERIEKLEDKISTEDSEDEEEPKPRTVEDVKNYEVYNRIYDEIDDEGTTYVYPYEMTGHEHRALLVGFLKELHERCYLDNETIKRIKHNIVSEEA